MHLKSPLIHSLHHFYTTAPTLQLPPSILNAYGDNVVSLTKSAAIVNANRGKAVRMEENGIGVRRVLLGFYSDKKCLELDKTVLMEVEVCQGETVKTRVGQVLSITIPIPNAMTNVKDRLYYLELSDPEYRY